MDLEATESTKSAIEAQSRSIVRELSTTMPTPESESFKAQKPTVLPTFDGVDYNDNKALKAAQDAVIREQWVQSMMARLIRDELGKCYRREGVNHLENCGHLRGMLELKTRKIDTDDMA